MNWKKDYEAKRMSAAEAVKLVRSGDRVYAGTASSVAYGLLAALWDRRHELENVEISFAEQAREGVPAMMEGVEACSRQGFTVMNVDTLICKNVTITGQKGDAFIMSNIDYFEEV